MPTIIMSKLASRLDGSIKSKTLTFLEKLGADDTMPGLHIEPIAQSADRRVRTGRVNGSYRAVLFRLDSAGERHYVFHGVWQHDDAIAVARQAVLTINPVNGLPQIEAAHPGPAPPRQPEPVSEPVSEPVEPLLTRFGVTEDDLVTRLGLPADLARDALAARDEDALLELAQKHEGWAGLMLVDLAAGSSVDDVIERLDLQPAAGGEHDDDVLEAFGRTGAQSEFAFIGDQDELRRVIEAGDFGAWRVFLHPEQRRYVEASYRGPFRLSGGAGTGKTVVLVHRARTLATRRPDARIVLTTYTRNLADALGDGLAQLDPRVPRASRLGEPGVHVTGVDALVAAVLRQAGAGVTDAVEAVFGEPRAEIGGRTGTGRWRDVLETTSSGLAPEVANETFLAAEYATVVLPNRIRTEAEYLRVRRPGRGVALDRQKRAALWELVATYRARNRVDGVLDFAEAAAVASEWLTGPDARDPLADHVLVDEGQDLLPTHWQMLRALVPPGTDDLFLAEDSHQRIYGSRLVLSRLGINIVGRSRRLTLNYRTTAQNLRYAMSLLEGGSYVDLEDQPEETGYRSARVGPQPAIVSEPDPLTRLDHAATVLKDWASESSVAPETLAVLVRDQFHRDRFVAAMNERGVSVRAVDREATPSGKPLVMTMHRAKGMEFSRVLLYGVDATSSAEQARLAELEPADRADAELCRRSLEYVAATRARDQLVVIRTAP
jgi:superfamily I DNA/RNA helicase